MDHPMSESQWRELEDIRDLQAQVEWFKAREAKKKALAQAQETKPPAAASAGGQPVPRFRFLVQTPAATPPAAAPMPRPTTPAVNLADMSDKELVDLLAAASTALQRRQGLAKREDTR